MEKKQTGGVVNQVKKAVRHQVRSTVKGVMKAVVGQDNVNTAKKVAKGISKVGNYLAPKGQKAVSRTSASKGKRK